MEQLDHCLQDLLIRLNSVDITEIARKALEKFQTTAETINFAELSTTGATSFALIAAAEMGDKSQLVCMTLASRHQPLPVLWGAVIAFAFLNSLAVVFGAAIAYWLPIWLVAAAVSLLFAAFGIHAFWAGHDGEDRNIKEKSGHNLFFTTFLLITVAEFGDKTQLAVVALSSASMPVAVWLGATAALTFTSALGIAAGRTVLQKLPLSLLHRISGAIFLLLAVAAGYRGFIAYFNR